MFMVLDVSIGKFIIVKIMLTILYWSSRNVSDKLLCESIVEKQYYFKMDLLNLKSFSSIIKLGLQRVLNKGGVYQ